MHLKKPMILGSLTKLPFPPLNQDRCQLSQWKNGLFLSSCTRLLDSLDFLGRDLPPFSEFPPRTVDTWGPSTLVPVDCSCWRLLHRPISYRSEEMKDLSYVPFPTLVTMESKEGLRRDSWQFSHIQDNETEAKVREMVCLD